MFAYIPYMDPMGYAPWCWYIYLQNWVSFMVNVGKNIPSTMEHLGL